MASSLESLALGGRPMLRSGFLSWRLRRNAGVHWHREEDFSNRSSSGQQETAFRAWWRAANEHVGSLQNSECRRAYLLFLLLHLSDGGTEGLWTRLILNAEHRFK
ncbi:hypothetical protein P885DRAFT_61444 [Corynascus similis CBS 632.67]